MKHNELISLAIKWLKKQDCTLFAPEFVTSAKETPDVMGWTRRGASYLIECKISIEDFKADKKKTGNRIPEFKMGNYKYYFCLLELVVQLENKIPDGWGLISVHVPLKRPIFAIEKECSYQEGNKNEEILMLLSGYRRLKIKTLSTGMI